MIHVIISLKQINLTSVTVGWTLVNSEIRSCQIYVLLVVIIYLRSFSRFYKVFTNSPSELAHSLALVYVLGVYFYYVVLTDF